MGELLTLEEIKSRYHSERVLIGDHEEDESLEILRGRVLFHGPDADKPTSGSR